MLSFAHATGYALEKHEHGAVDCEICVRTKLQNLPPADPYNGTCLVSHELSAKQPPASLTTSHGPCKAGITRGPPLFS